MFLLYFQLNFVVTRNNFPDTKRQLVFLPLILTCMSWQNISSQMLNRLSERSVRDPRVCELLVDKVEEKDLGKWRSELENGELG